MQSLRRAVTELRATPRRQWCTTFVLVCLLSGIWALASPLFSGPDEQHHVVRAAAVSRQQLTGDEPARDDVTGGKLEVSVPRIYGDPRISCFANHPERPASCQSFEGPSDDGPVLTSAGRHPPAYYAVVGVVSRPFPAGSASVYLMRLVGVLVTGAFVASAVVALRRTASPRIAAVGMALAMTPMVLFVSGIVNPSAFEIAAGITLWSAGAVLATRSGKRVEPGLVALVGVAATTLVLSRQLGPLWLALTGVTLVALGDRDSLRALARSRVGRLWAGVVGVCTVAQLLWLAIVKPLDTSLFAGEPVDLSSATLLRRTVGAGFTRYRDLIGSFGWLDTPAPAATILLWSLMSGALILMAVTFARRRDALVVLALVVATFAVPVVLEYQGFRGAGGFFWQGRYTLPLAVGVPIVAALSIARVPEADRILRSPLLPVLGALVVVAHVLAFAQTLRRNTVGLNGPIWYWRHEDWHPPLSSWLLTAGFLVAIVLFVTWLLAPDAEQQVEHLGEPAP